MCVVSSHEKLNFNGSFNYNLVMMYIRIIVI